MVTTQASRTRARGACALAGVLLTAASLAACGGGSDSTANASDQSTDAGSSGGSGGSASGGEASSPSSTSSPSPTTMSSGAFAASLTAVNSKLAPDFTAVVNAHSQDAVKKALNKLADDAEYLSTNLPDDPPEALDAPTRQLSSALDSLHDSAGATAEDVGTAVCTSGSAVAELTRSTGAKDLRAAASALGKVNAAYGKAAGGFMPGPIADKKRQLANGQVLRHSSGPGSLTINNSGTDAIVTLTKVGTKTPVASVYVRADADTTLSDIPGRTFDIYVASGTDWDSAAQKFTRECSYEKTDSTWDFSSDDWTLTLTEQVNGNLSVSQLNAGDAPNP